MFVAIQKIMLKKANEYGGYKEYKVESFALNLNGVKTTPKYTYEVCYDAGRFIRPHHEAYKISLHHNYRENGRVKSKQCVICTTDYYTLAEDFFSLYDYADRTIHRASELFEVDYDTIYEMIETKLAPLQKLLIAEFHESEEYISSKKHHALMEKYRAAKAAFAKKYQVEESEYDYCYNVFGELMNASYLKKIADNAKSYRSYSNYSSGNYSDYSNNYGGYFNSEQDNYTDDEKITLKIFYKELSKKFHPDMNIGKDTTKQMQLLNKLKSKWKV